MKLPASTLEALKLTLGFSENDLPLYIEKRFLGVLAEFYIIHGYKYEPSTGTIITEQHQQPPSGFILSQMNKKTITSMEGFKFYFDNLSNLEDFFTNFKNSPNPLAIDHALFLITINSVFMVLDLRYSDPLCYCPQTDEIIKAEDFFHAKMPSLFEKNQGSDKYIEINIFFLKDEQFSKDALQNLIRYTNAWSLLPSTVSFFESLIQRGDLDPLIFFLNAYQNTNIAQATFNIVNDLSMSSLDSLIHSTSTWNIQSVQSLSSILLELHEPIDLINISIMHNAYGLLLHLIVTSTGIKEKIIESRETLLRTLALNQNSLSNSLIFEIFLSSASLDDGSDILFLTQAYNIDPICLINIISTNPQFFKFINFFINLNYFFESLSTKNIYNLIKNNDDIFLTENHGTLTVDRKFSFLFQKVAELPDYYSSKIIDKILKSGKYADKIVENYSLIHKYFRPILIANDMLISTIVEPEILTSSVKLFNPYPFLIALKTTEFPLFNHPYFDERTIFNVFIRLIELHRNPSKDLLFDIKLVLTTLKSEKLILSLVKKIYSQNQILFSQIWFEMLDNCFENINSSTKYPPYNQNSFTNLLIVNQSFHAANFTPENSSKNSSLLLGVCLGMALCYLHAYEYEQMEHFFNLLHFTKSTENFNHFKKKYVAALQEKLSSGKSNDLENLMLIKSYLDNILYLQDRHLYNNEIDNHQGLYPILFNEAGMTALASTVGIYTKDEVILMFSNLSTNSPFANGCSYLITTPTHAMSFVCDYEKGSYLFDPNSGMISSPIKIAEILQACHSHDQKTADLRPVILLTITLISKKDTELNQAIITGMEHLESHQDSWFFEYKDNPILFNIFSSVHTKNSSSFLSSMYTLPGKNYALELICKNILTMNSHFINNEYLISGLENCILYENFHAFKEIISSYPSIINQTDAESETLLIKAVKHNKIKFVEFLLSFDSINLKIYCNLGLNALSYAVTSYELSFLLLSNASDQELFYLITDSKTKEHPIIHHLLEQIAPHISPILSMQHTSDMIQSLLSSKKPVRKFSYYVNQILNDYNINNIELQFYADELSSMDLCGIFCGVAQSLCYPLSQYFYGDLITALINTNQFDILDYILNQDNLELLGRTQHLIQKKSANSWIIYASKNIEFVDPSLIIKSINEYPCCLLIPFLTQIKAISNDEMFSFYLLELIRRNFHENLEIRPSQICDFMKTEDFDWPDRWLSILEANHLTDWIELIDLINVHSLERSSHLLIEMKKSESSSLFVSTLQSPSKIKEPGMIIFSDAELPLLSAQNRPSL